MKLSGIEIISLLPISPSLRHLNLLEQDKCVVFLRRFLTKRRRSFNQTTDRLRVLLSRHKGRHK